MAAPAHPRCSSTEHSLTTVPKTWSVIALFAPTSRLSFTAPDPHLERLGVDEGRDLQRASVHRGRLHAACARRHTEPRLVLLCSQPLYEGHAHVRLCGVCHHSQRRRMRRSDSAQWKYHLSDALERDHPHSPSRTRTRLVLPNGSLALLPQDPRELCPSFSPQSGRLY